MARHSALKAARQSWETTWRDIHEQMLPYRATWDVMQRNDGRRLESHIINSTPTQALGTLAAGMMAGVTSPSRQWFSLQVEDEERNRHPDVKRWLDDCYRIIAAILQGANWYTSLADGGYLDLGSIGTAAIFCEEHATKHAYFQALPTGQYCLDVDRLGNIDTCFREIPYSTRQMVQEFGIDRVSRNVREAYERGELDATHRVIHAIYPNDDYERGKLGPRGKRWASCWFDPAEDQERLLREGGYEEFPIMAPRWSVRPGDVYGRGPGWTVRGDCHTLQLRERQLAKMGDKSHEPPMKASGNIKRASVIPGAFNHVGKGDSAGMLEPLFEINPAAMASLLEHIKRDEDRIHHGLYAHLWTAILNDQRSQRATATEIEAQRDEIASILGPLLERLDGDLLDPAITRVVGIATRRGLLPRAPDVLQGQQVQIKFISVLHLMQQRTKIIGIRTLLQEVAGLSSLRPDAADKLNVDRIVDEIADVTGVPPDAVLSTEEVDEVRQARAQQEQAKQAGESLLQATQGAKNLGGIDPQNLADVAGALAPAAAAHANIAPIGVPS